MEGELLGTSLGLVLGDSEGLEVVGVLEGMGLFVGASVGLEDSDGMLLGELGHKLHVCGQVF